MSRTVMRHPVTGKKGRALTPSHRLEDLEEERIRRLYALRAFEGEILTYQPQSSAPASLRQAYTSAKVALQQLDLDIRRLRHRY